MSLKRSNSLYKSTLNKQTNKSLNDQKNSKLNSINELDISLTDFTCPICLEVLVEPVQMPCHHELCLPCFKQMTDLTNLTCPMCRMRISTWSRQAANSNSLVNQERWNFIKKAFPIEIKNRIEGKTAKLLAESIERQKKGESSINTDKNVHCSKPGEIRKEYQDYLKREQERIRIEKENEEKKSLEFIQKLIQEEEHLSINDYLNLINTNTNSSITTPITSSSLNTNERLFNDINNHLNERIKTRGSESSTSVLNDQPTTSSLRRRPTLRKDRENLDKPNTSNNIDELDENRPRVANLKRKQSTIRNGKRPNLQPIQNLSNLNYTVLTESSMLSNEDENDSNSSVRRSLRPRTSKQARN